MCGICKKINSNYLCNKCEITLNEHAVFGIDDYKNDKDKYFEEHMYIFFYEGIIRNKIINYKFNDTAYLYKTFTNFLLKNEKIVEKIKSYDIILPVPISKKRYKERGYNQSSLIAKEISKKLKIKLQNDILCKTKNIIPQSNLNKEERRINIQGAYKLKNPNLIQNKKILIVDDIYTTGSTVNECSKTIKQTKVEKIGILTIAKD